MSYQTKDAARYSRAQWIERFETFCIRLRPKMRGRVDFEAAHYYYVMGLTPQAAAEEWLRIKPVSA